MKYYVPSTAIRPHRSRPSWSRTVLVPAPRVRHPGSPGPNAVRAAIDIHQRTGASFWDAMILRSAQELGCQILYSEDLNAGQEYEGVEVRTPFPA